MVKLWLILLAQPYALRLVALIAAVVYWSYVCLAPMDSTEPPWINDKLAHFLGNFGLTGLAFIANAIRHYGYLPLAVVAYSLLIECIQSVLPSRYFSWYDMLANIGGVLVAMGVIVYLRQRASAGRYWV